MWGAPSQTRSRPTLSFRPKVGMLREAGPAKGVRVIPEACLDMSPRMCDTFSTLEDSALPLLSLQRRR